MNASGSRSFAVIGRLLPQNQFGRNVTTVATGVVLGQGLVALSSPLLTRLYEPASFGILGVYASILSILTGIVALRYEQAIAIAPKDEDAAALLRLCFLITAGVCTAVALTTILFGASISQVLRAPALERYLWLLPLALLMAGAAQSLSYWHIRRNAYQAIRQSTLAQGGSQAIVQVGLGYARFGVAGLIVGDIVGWGTAAGSLFGSIRHDSVYLLGNRSARVREVARRYKRFPFIASWSGLTNSAAQQLPLLLIAGFYGPTIAGLFALSQQVVAVPVVFLGKAVAQVYLGELSRRMREGDSSLRQLYASTARKLLMIAAVPMLIVLVAGPSLFAVVFGDRWRAAGDFAQLLSIAYLVQFVVYPLAWTLTLVERQDIQLAWDVGRLLLVSGGLILAGLLEWSPTAAVAAYGLTVTCSYLALGWLSVRHLPATLKGAVHSG